MRRRVVVAAIGLGVLQLATLVSLAVVGPESEPRLAPVRVVAPDVVASFIVDRVGSLPGKSLEVQAIATPEEARRSIREGRSVAAVVVDLRREVDTLYVAGANGQALNRALLRIVNGVESTYGRKAEVRDVVPVQSHDRVSVYALTGFAILLGFGVAVLLTGLGGPVPRDARAEVRRLALVAAIAVVVGAALGSAAAILGLGGALTWWPMAAALVLVCAMTTLALEGIFGVFGIGVASSMFVLTAAPLISLTHPLLLPQPWAAITPWLPHGAALDAATGEAFFGGPDLQPLLVLVVWGLFSAMTLMVARRERGSATA